MRIFLGALLTVLLLGACGGSEERLAMHLEKAQQYYKHGSFDKAAIEARNVLQINPWNAQGRYLMALLNEQHKDWKSMFGNLSIAIEEDPHLVRARVKLGQFQLINQMYDQALEQADAVLVLESENPDALALRASVLYRQDKPDEAIKEAERALSAENGHVGAIAVMSRIYLQDDADKALAFIEAGINLRPDNVALKLLKIRVLESRHDRWGDVIAVCQQLVASDPNNLAYAYKLISVYQRQGRNSEAEKLVRELVVAHPGNDQVKLWHVKFVADNESLEAAGDLLQGYIAGAPDNNELRFAMAKLLVARGQQREAASIYSALLSLDASSADSIKARNGLVQIAMANQKREEAEELLAQIFELEPENSEALITRANLYLIDKNTDEAIAHLHTVLRNDPESVETLMLLARAHEVDGSRELAVDNYRQVLAIESENALAQFSLARLLLASGDVKHAEDHLRSLLEYRPDNTQARFLLVSSLMQQERWDQALRETASLLESPETRVQGSFLKGRILYGREDYEGSIKALEQMLAENADVVEALQYLLSAYSRANRVEDGVAYLKKHIESHPEHFHAYQLLGDYYRQAGEPHKALASYEKALELAPENALSYQKLSAQYVSMGDQSNAIEILDQGVRRLPDALALQMLLAGLYDRNRDYDRARSTYASILKVQSESKWAANNLAILLVDHFGDEASLAQAKLLSETLSSSEEPAVLDTVGWVNYKLGDFVRAVTLMERASQLGGKGAEYDYHLGMAYYKSGQNDQAREKLESALADEARFSGREEAEKSLKEMKKGS